MSIMAKKLKEAKKNAAEKPTLRALERDLVELYETCVTTCKYIFKELAKQGFKDEDMSLLHEKLKENDFNFCLLMAAELIKCEPFMDKRQTYSTMLEGWSCYYDLLLTKCKILRTKLLKIQKDKDPETYAVLTAGLATEEKKLSASCLKFSEFRVLTHIENGVYKPPPEMLVDPNSIKRTQKSFIHVRGLGEMSKAVKDGDFEQVKLLLEIGEADPNELDIITGSTPIHHACWTGKADIAEILLKNGANVNAQTLRGFTPLHYAYQKNFKQCVKVLLAHGADVTIKSSLGKTPGQMKVSNKSQKRYKPAKPFY